MHALLTHRHTQRHTHARTSKGYTYGDCGDGVVLQIEQPKCRFVAHIRTALPIHTRGHSQIRRTGQMCTNAPTNR